MPGGIVAGKRVRAGVGNRNHCSNGHIAGEATKKRCRHSKTKSCHRSIFTSRISQKKAGAIPGGKAHMVDSNPVKHNLAEGQFEIVTEGKTAVLQYRRSGDSIRLLHTEVPESLRGRGLANQLARGPRLCSFQS